MKSYKVTIETAGIHCILQIESEDDITLLTRVLEKIERDATTYIQENNKVTTDNK